MTAGPQRISYGAHPSQFGELSRPAGRSTGTVMLLHGGFWRATRGLELNRRQAADLADRGWTCWNVEYRRLGEGGGWPGTFHDVAAAADLLADLDVDREVVVVGHSAGGTLAAWLAGGGAVEGVRTTLRPRAAIVLAGVLDLAAGSRSGLGEGAIDDLLGGGSESVPDRYLAADPRAAVPPPVPVVCVHGQADERVPLAQSAAYVAAVRDAGGHAELVEVDGDHLSFLDPESPAAAAVRAALIGSAVAD